MRYTNPYLLYYFTGFWQTRISCSVVQRPGNGFLLLKIWHVYSVVTTACHKTIVFVVW